MDRQATGWRVARDRCGIEPGNMAWRVGSYSRWRSGVGAALVGGLRHGLTWENCPLCCGVVLGFLTMWLV